MDDEEMAKYSSRDKPMMVGHFSISRGGEQLAVGMYNKKVMTVYTGDLVKDQKAKVKGKGKDD
jgi:hypothetical protein